MFTGFAGQHGQHKERGFSLVEMALVLLVLALLGIWAMPAFSMLVQTEKAYQEVRAIYDLLEKARAFAMAHQSYVWVGFADGNGAAERLVLSAIASRDGSQIFNPALSADTNNRLDVSRATQLSRLLRLQRVRLADVSNPSGLAGEWESRPGVKRGPVLYRIGATTPAESRFPFQYPVGDPVPPRQYEFRKTIQFNTRGEAVINGSYSCVPWMEIGLEPVIGNRALTNQQSAIQLGGMSGSLRLFQR